MSETVLKDGATVVWTLGCGSWVFRRALVPVFACKFKIEANCHNVAIHIWCKHQIGLQRKFYYTRIIVLGYF